MADEHFTHLSSLSLQEPSLPTPEQPILVGLETDSDCHPGGPNVLCALVMNATETLVREVRIRFYCPELSDSPTQPRPIRLLDGGDTLPVYFSYRAPLHAIQATLTLEVDVCDQHGQWHAYNSHPALTLDFPNPADNHRVTIRSAQSASVHLEAAVEQSWVSDAQTTSLARLKREPSLTEGYPLPHLEQMVTITLEPDSERTRSLQAKAAARPSVRGTPLTRALLCSQNPAHAPLRIELVSRPFMVFGRFNERHRTGFGDFALGFVSEPRKISRLHCAVRAIQNGLMVMHTGSQQRRYTALNGKLLARGDWQPLESGDSLDVSGLYTLRVSLAFDVTPGLRGYDEAVLQSEQIGRCLLDVIEALRALDTDPAANVREQLKTAYLEMIRLQSTAARGNGSDSAGTLIYASFLRQGAEPPPVAHIYLPKWLPIGSAATDGLQIRAEGVRQHHAELLFKEGMYWIRNHAGQGDIRVCSHSLGPHEIIALEDGDSIGIGAARFTFECY